MKCYCCDVRLTPKEACTRFKESGQFTETCTKCLKTMDGVNVIAPTREFEEDSDGELEE